MVRDAAKYLFYQIQLKLTWVRSWPATDVASRNGLSSDSGLGSGTQTGTKARVHFCCQAEAQLLPKLTLEDAMGKVKSQKGRHRTLQSQLAMDVEQWPCTDMSRTSSTPQYIAFKWLIACIVPRISCWVALDCSLTCPCHGVTITAGGHAQYPTRSDCRLAWLKPTFDSI